MYLLIFDIKTAKKRGKRTGTGCFNSNFLIEKSLISIIFFKKVKTKPLLIKFYLLLIKKLYFHPEIIN